MHPTVLGQLQLLLIIYHLVTMQMFRLLEVLQEPTYLLDLLGNHYIERLMAVLFSRQIHKVIINNLLDKHVDISVINLVKVFK